MKRRLLLWDIDGTLLRAGHLGAEAFDQAVADVAGRPPRRRPEMSGKTDPQILGEYLADLGVPVNEDTIATAMRALAHKMAARAGEIGRLGTVCAGVPALLSALAGDPRVVNGVLTGNIAPNAVVKLSALGLEQWLDLTSAAFGSDDADRTKLVPIAMERLARAHHVRLGPEDVWVIGDTPRDLDCARAAGVRCLLVATGRFGLAQLADLGADATLEDLADTDVVIKLLTGDL